MLSVKGTYHKGALKLEEEVPAENPRDVIVTFLEDETREAKNGKTKPPVVNKRLTTSDFSFREARDLTNDYKGSLSDAVIEERREGKW